MYKKQNFSDGSVLTAEQLNHMETGIAEAHDALPKKLTKPETAKVGDYLRISAVNTDGSFTVEAVPAPTVPTKVSELTNDAGYQTAAQVNALLAAFPTFEIQVVAQLPAEGADKTIYLVPFADDSGSYLEYLYVNGAWEVIGSGKDSGEKVNLPVDESGAPVYGTAGQYAVSDGKGGIRWVDEAADEEPADVLVGTLPYTVNESGLYIVSNTNATISTGEGGNQLLDLTAVTVEMIAGTYNSIEGEVLGANTIKIGTNGSGKNASATIASIPVTAGATYTLLGRVANTVDVSATNSYGGNSQITVRTGNQDATSQLNAPVTGDLSAKTIIVDSDTDTLDLQVIMGADIMASADAEVTVVLYLYQGELTELPAGATFEIAAGEHYDLDAYLGMTLSTDTEGATVNVYKSVSVTSNDSVVFLGDSIAARSRVADEYTKRTGNPAMSCAVGGTRLTGSRDSSAQHYPCDMTQIADAIASGDFSTQIASGLNTNFAVLASGNIANYKMVLEFGTNDYPLTHVNEAGETVSTVRFRGTDPATSIEGAMRYILDTILTKYPTMRIVVLSTLKYITIGSGDESGVPVHDDGTVWQMNEVIRDVCIEYGVPFVDMFHAMGLSGITRNALLNDGVHLMVPQGVKRYMDTLAGQLNALGI